MNVVYWTALLLAYDFRNKCSVLRIRYILYAVSIEEEEEEEEESGDRRHIYDAVVMHFTNLEFNFVTRRKTDFEQMSALRVELTEVDSSVTSRQTSWR